jgi:2-polyprenyl-3-methyl-5-hydroxy-6-metoxy-1,4-benzoquinol methylase
MHFNPILNRYYLSNANVDVNYFVVCRNTMWLGG